MKLVLDYIYGGAMYLCGAHMQYVIQVEAVQEVLPLVFFEYLEIGFLFSV
jgi:hypothetical protein